MFPRCQTRAATRRPRRAPTHLKGKGRNPCRTLGKGENVWGLFFFSFSLSFWTMAASVDIPSLASVCPLRVLPDRGHVRLSREKLSVASIPSSLPPFPHFMLCNRSLLVQLPPPLSRPPSLSGGRCPFIPCTTSEWCSHFLVSPRLSRPARLLGCSAARPSTTAQHCQWPKGRQQQQQQQQQQWQQQSPSSSFPFPSSALLAVILADTRRGEERREEERGRRSDGDGDDHVKAGWWWWWWVGKVSPAAAAATGVAGLGQGGREGLPLQPPAVQ